MTCLEQRQRQLEELKHTSINPLVYVVEWYYPGLWNSPCESWAFDSIEDAEQQREHLKRHEGIKPGYIKCYAKATF